jgi:phosphoribosylformylglycinamidine cyclo-ligase
MLMADKYAEAGVDIGREGDFVSALTSGLDQLPGVFAKYLYRDGKAIGMSTDGVGSKILCYLMKGDASGAAYDLAAMNFNDLAAEFIRPLLFVDYIAIPETDERLAEQLCRGLASITRESGVILSGGETASLPDQIKEGTFDWAGAVAGVEEESSHREWIAKRDALTRGLYVVGIEGYDPERQGYTIQSNGLTLARKLLITHKPDDMVTSRTVIDELTAPSLVLSPLMVGLRDSGLVYFFAPITGGGYTNIARVLPDGLDAGIRFDMRPGTIFQVIQDEFEVSDEEMYKVFNMGHVMAIGTDRPGEVIDTVKKNGLRARGIGELRDGSGRVVVNGMDLGKY